MNNSIGIYSHTTLLVLFDAVKRCVSEAGGDGDGYIICGDNYVEYANLFAKHEEGQWFTDRTDDPRQNAVNFYGVNGNEAVHFLRDDSELSLSMSEIVVGLLQ